MERRFIGRERELSGLQELYDKSGFSMTIVYGRRRIGKSTLIAEFIKDKRAVFYTATKVGKERNTELFASRVTSVLDRSLSKLTFPDIESVFDFIAQKVGAERLIIVIDELPYWAEKDESLLSVLQKYIDTVWKDKNIFLILCGSALSFMENKVLSEKSPLFGRRDSQIKLEAFHYRDAAKFVPDYTYEEKAICYGVTGGVAKYLAMFDPDQELDENIRRLFFRRDGYLYDETRNLLTQEFSEVALVNNIIEQIASGINTVNMISQKIGESASAVMYALDRLMGIDLVENRRCITEEKNRKKSQYILKDHMFQFWYRFIPHAASIIELGQGEIYYDTVVRPELHAFMGSVFEDICRYYTLEAGVKRRFGNFITNTGCWWGTENLDPSDRKKQQSADIDVVGISELDKTAVIGECKFKNEKIDKDIYETLLRRAGCIGGKYRIIKYLFFSLSGYTDWVMENAGDEILLLTIDDLYQDADFTNRQEHAGR